MFTTSQLILMFIITEVLIWHILSNALATIRCCVMSKAYQKELEAGLQKHLNEIKNEKLEDKK